MYSSPTARPMETRATESNDVPCNEGPLRAGLPDRIVGQLRGEEVDEQLVDALSLVVVDPVRCAGQALDAVEVRDVLGMGLGELAAEVAVALPPDDQGGRGDRAKRLLGPQSHRGAVMSIIAVAAPGWDHAST